MSPQQKAKANSIFTVSYRGVTIAMLAFCSWVLQDIYVQFRAVAAQTQRLNEFKSHTEELDKNQSENISELKGRVNYLVEKSWKNK